MLLRVIDFETTGLAPPAPGLGVCEVGWTDLTWDGKAWWLGTPHAVLVNPGCPIPPEASAVHGSVDADVAGAPCLGEVLPRLWLGDPAALCGHNLRFEKQWFSDQQQDDTDWIDTYACSLRLAPDCKSHALQYLRYFLKLDVDEAMAQPRHRAGADTHVTAVLIKRMLAKVPVEQLVEMSKGPLLLTRIPKGKHYGEKFRDVDIGWLDWVVNKATGMDEDVTYAAKAELRRRKANGHGEAVDL